MKADPQLEAVRQAAKERFLAQKAPPTGLPASLAHLRPEQLDQPIASLLADDYRPAKRAKVEAGGACSASRNGLREIGSMT